MADRLDQYLVAHGLVETRTKAQRRIDAGDVTVNGQVVTKVSTPVPDDAEVLVRGSVDFVGRGALKLEAALKQWDISIGGLRVLDIGASTGGFTQVLLTHKAAHVVALDVGHDQIHHSLRSDPRVTVWEGVNARTLSPHWWSEHKGGHIDFIVVDVSFISLIQIIPPVVDTVGLTPWVCLVKPQFEVGRTRVHDGLSTNPDDHEQALNQVIESAQRVGLHPVGVMASPITGEAGNREYLCWFDPTPSRNQTQWTHVIREVVHS